MKVTNMRFYIKPIYMLKTRNRSTRGRIQVVYALTVRSFTIDKD